MRTVAVTAFALGLLVASAVPYAVAEATGTPPPGVAAANWIPISSTAGFVITNEGIAKLGGLSGHFMAVHSGKWVRLNALNTVQTFGGH